MSVDDGYFGTAGVYRDSAGPVDLGIGFAGPMCICIGFAGLAVVD